MKTKIIPFDLEIAKKIQAGEIEGKIVTSRGFRARLLATDLDCYHCLAVAYFEGQIEDVGIFDKKGNYWDERFAYRNLHIELPEESPKHEFKPFDRVLVRNDDREEWIPRFYSRECPKIGHWAQDGDMYKQCIPYKGNEHLVGTTDKPKEE